MAQTVDPPIWPDVIETGFNRGKPDDNLPLFSEAFGLTAHNYAILELIIESLKIVHDRLEEMSKEIGLERKLDDFKNNRSLEETEIIKVVDERFEKLTRELGIERIKENVNKES